MGLGLFFFGGGRSYLEGVMCPMRPIHKMGTSKSTYLIENSPEISGVQISGVLGSIISQQGNYRGALI